MSTNWLSNLYKFEPNLDAYFERINYTGSRVPNVDTLRHIQWHHLRTIPFENLDVHIKGQVSIDPADIERKIVFEGRGGYCFEQNVFCMWILKALGYKVKPVLARNRWMKPSDIVSPTTHIVLIVNIEDNLYLYDVGYSANPSTYPLEIWHGNEQPTALEPRRIIKLEEEDAYMNQIFIQNEWKDVFRFTLDESYPYDWHIGNFYVSNCITFTIYQNIVVSISNETTRYTLLNNIFTTRHIFEGTSEVVEIWTESEYLKVLREVFKIKLPEDCKIRPRMITWKD